MRTRHFVLGLWAAALFVPAALGAVRVNEVLFAAELASANPVINHQWVELVNTGPAAANLAAWRLAAGDGPEGAGARGLPQINMPPGAYLVIHYASGPNDLDLTDGCGHYYTGDPPGALVLGVDRGECGLYGPGVVDYVAWYRGTSGFLPGATQADAIIAGIWSAGAFFNTARIGKDTVDAAREVSPGQSIGRDKDSAGPVDPA